MRKALEEGHPTLYWYTSKEELDQAFEEAYSQISGEMTEREYLQLLTPLIEKIHCGHTVIKPSKAYTKYLEKKARFFPLDIRIEPSYALYVRKNHGADSLVKKGDQLLLINERPTEQLSRKFVAYTTGDGYIETAKFKYAEKRFSYLLQLYAAEPDTFAVTLLRNGVDTLEVKLPSLTKEEFSKIKKAAQKRLKKEREASANGAQQERPAHPAGALIYAKGKNEFRVITNDSIRTGYLLIRSFKEAGFGKLYKTTFRWLAEHQVENLVIDLRENSGGSSAAAIALMQHLSADEFPYYKSIAMKKKRYSFKEQLDSRFWVFAYSLLKAKEKNHAGTYNIEIFGTGKVKAAKLHFDKNVYVLTSGLTASASSLFSANMQHQKKATFIGEETGGGYYGCAGIIIPYLTLPASKVRLRFPLMQVLGAVGGKEPGRGILPDHEVPLDLQSFLEGTDNQLGYTLELISQKNKNISRQQSGITE